MCKYRTMGKRLVRGLIIGIVWGEDGKIMITEDVIERGNLDEDSDDDVSDCEDNASDSSEEEGIGKTT